MDNTVYLLRKELKLSQEKFGDMLGVTGAGISKIESGDRNLTDSMAKLICSTFNVNLLWLRTGNGPIFISSNLDDEVPQLMSLISSKFYGDPVKQQFIVEILKLLNDMDKNQWDVIVKFAESISNVANSVKIED
jgi:transcriptional regulator with XRE-family HTH domain